MKVHVLLIPLLLMALWGRLAAGAQLEPVEDIYVRGGTYADDNFANEKQMNCKWTSSSTNNNRREAFVQFDLTGYNSVSKADLVIHVRVNNRATLNPILDISEVTDNSWDEDLITYNTKPTIGTVIVSQITPAKGQWMTIDLRDAVNAALANGATLWSIAFTGGDTTGATLGFATKEDTNGRKPYLVVEEAPITVQSTVLEDSFVRDSSPSNIYGAYSSLTVSYGTSHDKRYSYVKMDIAQAALSPLITEAKLELYVKDLDSAGMSINVYPVLDEAWGQDSITWNTQPGATNAGDPGYDLNNPILTNLVVPAETTWMTIDLTSYVSSKAAISQGTVSIAILPVEPAGNTAGLKTKFSSDESGSRPQFVMTFVPGAGGPSTPAPVTPSTPAPVTSAPTIAPSSAPSLSPVTLQNSLLEDSFVRDSSPSNIYGAYSSLTVSYGTSHDQRNTYLKMDIAQAALSPLITEAKVDLYVKDLDAAGMSVNVYPVLDEVWDQDTMTWNSQPGATNAGDPGFDVNNPILTNLVVPAETTWMTIDLTAYVSSKTAIAQSTVSIAIVSVEPAGNTAGLKTKFSSGESLTDMPLFTMTFVPLVPPPEPTAPPTLLTYPQLVSVDSNTGSLVYTSYANEINQSLNSIANPAAVNTVPDYSMSGYKGGGVAISFIATGATVSPTSGDRRLDIQAAIDTVSALTPDANGFRGAVLIEAGDYDVSEPGLSVTTSGVVIRGEGSGETGGTTITYTSTNRDSNLVNFGASTGGPLLTGSKVDITDTYVAVGAKSFTVADASSFAVGDQIVVELHPNNDWIDQLSDMSQHGWTASGYFIDWKRVITAISGNQITVDGSIVQAIESVYGGAKVWKYTFVEEITNVGVENIRFESIFASSTDENHGKSAVVMERVRDGWVRQVTAQYFWYGVVSLRQSTSHITVEDTAMLDHMGVIGGGRRYSFNIDDSDFLMMQRCLATTGRHDFVSGSRTPGPNVFVDGVALDSNADSGPHHRYSTGQLYDNIKVEEAGGPGEIRVRNRGSSGSGHGWSGAQVMFWNTASKYICDAPNGGMNWVIGNVGVEDIEDPFPEPNGIVQSENQHVAPRSLYYAQLKDRLGANALHSVVLPSQANGPIWDALETWNGDGLFGDAVVLSYDEESGAVTTSSTLSIGGIVRNLTLLGAMTVTYAWTTSSGPGTATFGDAAALETTAQFSAVGSYTLMLEATGGALVETGTINVVVS